jgi:ATP-binding cassette, subfamily F, member 3
LDQVTVTYVHDPIFAGLSWEIHDDRVVGLIGPNGAGKSSLLKLIAGELKSESGFLNRKSGLSMGSLRQDPRLIPAHTLWEEAVSASEQLARVNAELTWVEKSLGAPGVYGDEKKLARALDRQAHLLEQFTALGGQNYESRVRSTLLSLGFTEADFSLPVTVLSGGQKKLVGLAKLMVTQPDLLLLDEPDNHLDITGKDFLAQYIRGYKGAVVIISHDRYLLDLVVDEIAELEDGKLNVYQGNYSEYAFEKQVRMLRQQQLYQAQQKEITRLEQAAKRLLMWGKIYDNEKFSKRGASMMKRIEKIERIDKPVFERKKMGLELAGWRGSNKVLAITSLGKSFPDSEDSHAKRSIFSGLDFVIWHGERVGIVGPNGAGKSVLLRMILGDETPTSGEIALGPSIRTGYYAQEHETLDPDKTLLDTVRFAANCSESDAVAILGRFVFSYLQSQSKISTLSGGERSRLQMALLMISGANFLLLDEPTNNLDIHSAEVLESALQDFEGTVFVISHDRYFLDRVATRIVELEDGALTEYAGNYSDYREVKGK